VKAAAFEIKVTMCSEAHLDEIAKNHALALVVHNTVADVDVLVFENVEHGQNLAVVGHQSLADHLAGDNQLLYHLQHNHLRDSTCMSA
jgi:O-acetylhomoserine/O-acetylserine sulfhydrylase-like pyridoxal-dependent enzyme